jgi:hypothetical protein
LNAYRSRLPVGSGMGFSASAMSLGTKPVNLSRSAANIGHMLTALPSLASEGDTLVSEEFASSILTIMDEESTLTLLIQA